MKAPAPGTLIFRRFLIIRPLALGAERLVYLCRDTLKPERLIALKLFRADCAPEKAAAFWREAEFGRRVQHPNVVRCHERFENESFLGYSMEYVGGAPLTNLLSRSSEMSFGYLLKLLHQICLGLQAIHDHGIVHRDIKPDNIMLCGGSHTAKITDFGIAITGRRKYQFGEGTVYGTVPYLSPEYVAAGEVDARSDIYALGVIAYQMVTGTLPFTAATDDELLRLKVSCDPAPPAAIRRDCPALLSELVMTALQREPANRYQSAQQIGVDLIACDYPPELATFVRSGVWPDDLLARNC